MSRSDVVDKETPAKVVWLTTARVVEMYGFDPTGMDEPGRPGPLRSKLIVIGPDLRRVWLRDDVVEHAPKLAQATTQMQQEDRIRRAIFARIEADQAARAARRRDGTATRLLR